MRQPGINPQVYSPASIINNTLNATPTGSTNDAVLNWNVAGTAAQVEPRLAETLSAVNGTSIAVTQPGIYFMTLEAVITGAVPVLFALSQDCAAAALTGDPTYATVGVLKIRDLVGVAALNMGVELSCPVTVRRNAAFAAGGSVLRFHATNSAGAAPVGIVAASAAYRIDLIADCGA